jgi:hypothetical protein
MADEVGMRLIVNGRFVTPNDAHNQPSHYCAVDGVWQMVFFDYDQPQASVPYTGSVLPIKWYRPEDVTQKLNDDPGTKPTDATYFDERDNGTGVRQVDLMIDNFHVVSQQTCTPEKSTAAILGNSVFAQHRQTPCPTPVHGSLHDANVPVISEPNKPSLLSSGRHSLHHYDVDFVHRTTKTNPIPLNPTDPSESQQGWYWVDNSKPVCDSSTISWSASGMNTISVTSSFHDPGFDNFTGGFQHGSGMRAIRISYVDSNGKKHPLTWSSNGQSLLSVTGLTSVTSELVKLPKFASYDLVVDLLDSGVVVNDSEVDAKYIGQCTGHVEAATPVSPTVIAERGARGLGVIFQFPNPLPPSQIPTTIYWTCKPLSAGIASSSGSFAFLPGTYTYRLPDIKKCDFNYKLGHGSAATVTAQSKNSVGYGPINSSTNTVDNRPVANTLAGSWTSTQGSFPAIKLSATDIDGDFALTSVPNPILTNISGWGLNWPAPSPGAGDASHMVVLLKSPIDGDSLNNYHRDAEVIVTFANPPYTPKAALFENVSSTNNYVALNNPLTTGATCAIGSSTVITGTHWKLDCSKFNVAITGNSV